MMCERCKSKNTEIINKQMNGAWFFVIHCRDCGEDRLPTAEERVNFNG